MVKTFDLEERTTEFAKKVIRLCKDLSRNPINDRLINQVVGSSGSIGANSREANDSLGKKDFLQKMRIARREAREALHWLELILESNGDKSISLRPLLIEALGLKKILSSIISKSE